MTRKYTTEFVGKVLREFKQTDSSIADLSERYNVSRDTLRTWIIKMGWSTKAKRVDWKYLRDSLGELKNANI